MTSGTPSEARIREAVQRVVVCAEVRDILTVIEWLRRWATEELTLPERVKMERYGVGRIVVTVDNPGNCIRAERQVSADMVASAKFDLLYHEATTCLTHVNAS